MSKDSDERLENALGFCWAHKKEIGPRRIRRDAEAVRQMPRVKKALAGNIRPGFVYVMKSEQRYKIGQSVSPIERCKTLNIGPTLITLIHSISVEDMNGSERLLHRHFAGKRIRGEWFDLSADDLMWLKQQTAKSLAQLLRDALPQADALPQRAKPLSDAISLANLIYRSHEASDDDKAMTERAVAFSRETITERAVNIIEDWQRPVRFEMDIDTVVGMISQLQLAFRQQRNNGSTRVEVEEFIRALIAQLDPGRGDLYRFLMRGFDEE